MRYLGGLNQAEEGAPATSAYGQGLRASIARRHVVNNPAPVGTNYSNQFGGVFGAFAARPAQNRGVYARKGYGGIFPMDQQPRITRPDPWSDPTLGEP
jgi:hypothetical protein